MATAAERNDIADGDYVARAEALVLKLRARSEVTNVLGRSPTSPTF